MKENVEDLAYDLASKLTDEWVTDQLKMRIVVSKMQMIAKFKEHYRDYLTNKRLSDF